jgi:exonuclease III
LIYRQFSFIGFQETRLPETKGVRLFNNYVSARQLHYVAYWSFDLTDRSGGVAIILSSFVSKYVQKIHRHGSRFIAVDIFLPAKKLKVVNIYNYQQNDFPSKGSKLAKFVQSHLEEARAANFEIIFLGDFNLSPTSFASFLAKGRTALRLTLYLNI